MAGPSQKYLPLFVAEATEQLEALAGELVRAELEAPGGGLWDSIFRRIHSVKGSAATLGLARIVDLSHAAESLIGKVKVQPEKPGRASIDLLLELRDLLAEEVRGAADPARSAAARTPEQDSAHSSLLARLSGAAAALPEPTPRPPVASQAQGAAAKPVVDPSIPRLDVTVILSQKSPAPGARALIVQRKLKALGVLLEIEPQPSQLMQTRGGGRITALLATEKPPDEVRAACAAVPEVESVDVRVAPLEPATGKREPETVPGAAPVPVKAQDPHEPRQDATVRVRADSLDQLLEAAGEVLFGIARVRDLSRRVPDGPVATSLDIELERLRRMARELHGRVMNARLTPFSALTERLPRAVRDLAHKLEKDVDLEIRGVDVEMDRTVVEALGDPLSHLVRNAVDHGLEAQSDRLAASKPLRGRLVVAARRERDKVYVDIEDDGRGLDPNRLREKAVSAGRLTAEAAAQLSDEQAWELAFLPGVSTRSEATDVSGRGVGLDAVQRTVTGLGGKLRVRSTPGRGTRFTLELPLAVSMSNLLLVQVGGELYGFPMARVIMTTEYDLSARGGEGFEARSIVVAGNLVRAYGLAKLFGLPSLAPPGPRPFVVLEVDGVRFALSVDRLFGQEEAVLKPLFAPLDRIRGLAATTLLGNGRPLLVLDPRGLAEMAGLFEPAGGSQKGAA